MQITTEQAAAAFNKWMDDYTKNPEAYEAATTSALRHLNEKLAGTEPTYGQEAAAIFEAYLTA